MFKWYFRRKQNRIKSPGFYTPMDIPPTKKKIKINIDRATGRDTHHNIFMVNGKIISEKDPQYKEIKRAFDEGMVEFDKGMKTFSKSMEDFGDSMDNMFKDIKWPKI